MSSPTPAPYPQPIAHPSFAGLIGCARADISPPAGIFARNWGAARHDAAEGFHRPLTATALTLQKTSDDAPLVLVTLDLCWWRTPEDEWHVRGGLLNVLNLQPSHVLVHFSHTHAGPSTCREDADQPGGEFIAAYLDQVRDSVVDVARRALAAAQPATLEWSYGHCDLAYNRDLPDPLGARFLVGTNFTRAADSTLLVGRVTTVEAEEPAKLVATLVNYACHPTTLAWDNRLISPDYVGAMRELVERQSGAPCLFLLGAAGDLGPREGFVGDLEIADKNGRQLGYAVLSTLEGMLPPRTRFEYDGVVESGAPIAIWNRVPDSPSPELETRCLSVELQLKELPSALELEEQLAGCGDRSLAERLRRKIRVRRTVGAGENVQLPIWVWKAGGAVFIAQREEAYSVMQIELRNRFPGHCIVFMNITNGSCGYLPPAPLYDEDIYPVWQTPYARGGHEKLLEMLVAALDEFLVSR